MLSSWQDTCAATSWSPLLVEVHESDNLLDVRQLIRDSLVDGVEPLERRAGVHELVLLNLNLDLIHLQMELSDVFLKLLLQELLLQHQLLVVDHYLLQLQTEQFALLLLDVESLLSLLLLAADLCKLLLPFRLNLHELAVEPLDNFVLLR